MLIAEDLIRKVGGEPHYVFSSFNQAKEIDVHRQIRSGK
jgi:hypothetical protein